MSRAERRKEDNMAVKCKGCEYCVDNRRSGNIRGSFHCDHPDQAHIIKYFKEHGIHKMEGFISFGESYSSNPSIKSSPKWCPKKVEDKDEQ